MATDLTEAKLIIKNIIIVMLAKEEGQINNEIIPSEDAKLFFVQRFSCGIQQSIVNSVLNLQIENYTNTKPNDQENQNNVLDGCCPTEMKNRISSIVVVD